MSPSLQIRLVRRHFSWTLMAWSLLSLLLGGGLWWLFRDRPMASGFWMECWVWGAIDAVFAALGIQQSWNSNRADEIELADARKLLKALKLSHAMNWGWVGLGLALLLSALFTKSAALMGHGLGVTLQGGFLFTYDRIFDRTLRQAVAE